MTYNPKIKNVSSKVTKVDSEYLRADKIYLDTARDPNDTGDTTFVDGLFADFQQDDRESLDDGPEGVTIGTAIDRINEVLAGLAPPPANTLSTLNTAASGKIEYLGLQEGDADTTVVGELSTRLSSVGEKQQFNRIISADNNYERLGTLSSFQEIIVVLNGTFGENLQGDQVNFPADAFNTTSSPKEESDIKVFLNDIDITSFVTVDFGTESSGKFASAEDFPIFKHNTGTVVILNTADVTTHWRKGHNYIQVRYGEGNSSETTHIDWVYAPDEASSQAYTMNLQNLTYESSTEASPKYISGIPYISDLTIKLDTGTSNIGNYAIQSYPTNYGFTILSNGATTSAAFSNKVANSFAGSEITAGDVDLVQNTLDVSDTSIPANADSMILGDILSFIYKVTNEHGKTGQESKVTTEKFLYDSNSTDNQPLYLTTNPVFEDFINETRRVADDADSSNISYSSNIALAVGQAAVYGGKLGHSSRIPVLTSVNVPSVAKPDYSSRNGDEEFMRVYRHSSALAKIRFKITCSSDAQFGSGNDVIRVLFRDGLGDWKDATNATTLGGIAINSPIAHNISNPQTGTTRNMDIDFGNAGINLDTDAYFKIIFPDNNVGTIDKIEVVAINS